jgi:hypothetical protein
MSSRLGGLAGIAAGCLVIVAGYRMGTTSGLAVMVMGVLVLWFIAHSVAWSIPTIGDVLDRPQQEGILVPRDLRALDPDIVQRQQIAGWWDTPSSPAPHPDDPGNAH